MDTPMHPVWENVKGGKVKATIRMTKKTKFYQGVAPFVHEEVIGNESDRAAMEAHVAAVLEWLARYDAFYSVDGWVYQTTWK